MYIYIYSRKILSILSLCTVTALVMFQYGSVIFLVFIPQNGIFGLR